jgi:hypothetical protein
MILVTVDGEKQVDAALQALVQRASPGGLADFLETEVDPLLRQQILLRFVNEGDSAVGRWAGLKQVTGRIRRNKGFSALHPINVRTGELREFVANSVEIQTTNVGASLSKPKRGGNRELQAKLNHAQTGGVGPTGPYPARPVIALTAETGDQIVKRLWTFFEEAINTAGGAP